MSKMDLLLQFEKTLSPSSSDFIPRKLDTTCDWIWSDEQFATWVNMIQIVPFNNRHQRLFCLYGSKGCGKSVLSSSIADTLQAQDKISTFFSFWAGSESQRKFTGLLKTTLWQLLKHLSAEDISQVGSILMRISSHDERSLREALDFTIKTIKSAVYVIIDGIDEAEKDWNDPQDASLSQVLDLLKAHNNAHILLCGRETSLSSAIISSSAGLKISQEFLRNDINTLIEWHLVNSSRSHVTQSRDLIRETLQAKSEMMFLWVNLVFKELNRSPSTSAMRAILNNTPPTLDEEYNRMFESLMKRLGGSSARPSVTMKAVKRIFSLTLAAPEPLTLAELGYAYAAEITISSAYDYELLTREGLIDICGDFVNEFNGHFHFAHASIEEFLARPFDQWSHADSNISYFRLDRLNSQCSLLEACFNYIRSMDMGYPIYDKGMHSLPQKYPLFEYASRFIPLLLANARAMIANSILEDFIASTQFCGLVEYVVYTLEMDSWDLALQYLDLLVFWREFNMPKSTLIASVKIELNRRERELGKHDPRYQTWASIGSMLSSFLDWHGTEHVREDTSVIHTSSLAADSSIHVDALALHSTAQNQRLSLAQLRPSILTLIRFRFLESLRSIRVDILPTWLLILWAHQTWNNRDKNKPRAKPMAEVALRRVRRRRNFTECYCLLLNGLLEDHGAQIHHGIENCPQFCCYQESIEIAYGLPASPQVEAVTQGALCGLMECLLFHEDREHAMIYSRQLEHTVCSNEVVQGDSGWLKRVFYQGSAWAKWRINVLQSHTQILGNYDVNEDSKRLNQFVLDLYAEKKWDQSPDILPWRYDMSRVLLNLRKYEECWANSKVMLEHSQRLEGTDHHAEYWGAAVSMIIDCLLSQDKAKKAIQWLSEIPFARILPIPEQAPSLGIMLLKVGYIDHAIQLYKSWGREVLMTDLRELELHLLMDEDALERILELGVGAKDALGTTALLWASDEGRPAVVEFLLSQGAPVEFRPHSRKESPLSIAAYKGHSSVVKLLLEQGADHEFLCLDGWTPLTVAASEGHDSVVKLLIESGIDKNSPTSDGWTPLGLAVSNGHCTVVKRLLDHGAGKDSRDARGWTPLELAVTNGHGTVVKLLLDCGADPNERDYDGYTLMAQARRAGQTEMVKILLDYGVQSEESDVEGETSGLEEEEERDLERNESSSEVVE